MPNITQDEFIAILLGDNGYDTASQRRGWFQMRFQKSYADELTVAEKSRAIDMLKAERDDA